MKTYIFLTTDGTEHDGAGDDADNCQVLAIEEADDVLTAYNQFLDSGVNQDHNSCFAYELVSGDVISHFDLLADTSEPTDCCCYVCGKPLAEHGICGDCENTE